MHYVYIIIAIALQVGGSILLDISPVTHTPGDMMDTVKWGWTGWTLRGLSFVFACFAFEYATRAKGSK